MEKIDAASLRERAIMFGAAALILVSLVDNVFIGPQFARERQAAGQIAQKQAEMKGLEEQMVKLVQARGADPDLANRQRAAQLNAKIGGAEQRVAAEQAKFTAPEQMRVVVEELLARNRRVKLIDMKTLPATTIADTRAQEGRPAPSPSSADRQVYRHGIELTVSGAYLDLLGYVSDLEKLPTQLYWGSLDLSAADYPRLTVKLTVYTLSLDKSWMSV